MIHTTLNGKNLKYCDSVYMLLSLVAKLSWLQGYRLHSCFIPVYSLIVAVCLPNDGLVLGGRRLRVWSRDCVLHSTSELLDGAEQSLNWRYLRLL